MKALTIRQPWASLIATGVKTIETRSWSTKHRGPLAIHAGMHPRPLLRELPGARGPGLPAPLVTACGKNERTWCEWADSLPLGAVVATCTVTDVVPMVAPGHVPPVNVATGEGRSILIHPDGSLWGNHCPDTTVFDWQDLTDQLPFGDFTPGRWAWLLTDIKPCDPAPAKGRLGMWDWEADRG